MADTTVSLIDAGADGLIGTADDVVVDSVVTDIDGSYLFMNITPGDYVVVVDSADPELAAFAPTTGAQSVGGFQSNPLTVMADQVMTDVDFGFDSPALNTITDTLWYDANGDGVLDPSEQGIAGVSVNLYADADMNGVPDDANGDGSPDVLATVITDINGDVVFSGLPDGDYICLLYTSPSPRDLSTSRMPSSA